MRAARAGSCSPVCSASLLCSLGSGQRALPQARCHRPRPALGLHYPPRWCRWRAVTPLSISGTRCWPSPGRAQATARSRCAVSVWKLDPAPRSCSFFVIVNVLLARSRAFLRGLHARAALLQRILRVAYLDADLLLQLLLAEFCLAIFQLGTILVGLGDAIANRNVEVQSHEVVGRSTVVGVFESAPEIRRQNGTCSVRPGSSDSTRPPVPCLRRSQPRRAAAAGHFSRPGG